MTRSGVATVARLELRQRMRSPRLRWVFGGWLAAVYGVVGLAWLASRDLGGADRADLLFGVITFFVLAMAMLVVPALTAGSINGDRERGVLATLQTTLLSPTEIALGKLVAALAAAATLLVVVAPVWLFALVSGGLGFSRVVLALLTIALTLACVCALGLMFSALSARSVTSTAATYLSVGALVVGTLIGFSVLSPLTKETAPRQVRVVSDGGTGDAACTTQTQERVVYRTDRLWWLLAMNPFVVVSDASAEVESTQAFGVSDPLTEIARSARLVRAGEPDPIDECWTEVSQSTRQTRGERAAEAGPVWPVGFAVLAGLTALGTWVAIRQLRTPVAKLPRGTRLA